MITRTYTDKDGIYRSIRTDHPVCRCNRGYASWFDFQCYRCRGGITAYDAIQRQKRGAKWSRLTKN